MASSFLLSQYLWQPHIRIPFGQHSLVDVWKTTQNLSHLSVVTSEIVKWESISAGKIRPIVMENLRLLSYCPIVDVFLFVKFTEFVHCKSCESEHVILSPLFVIDCRDVVLCQTETTRCEF